MQAALPEFMANIKLSNMRGFLNIKANVPEKAGNIVVYGRICLVINC